MKALVLAAVLLLPLRAAAQDVVVERLNTTAVQVGDRAVP
jgi:hypothetical protein